MESIEAQAREIRNLIEIEESNFDQSRVWPSRKKSSSAMTAGFGSVAMKTRVRRSSRRNPSSRQWKMRARRRPTMNDTWTILNTLFLAGVIPCIALGGLGEHGDTHALSWASARRLALCSGSSRSEDGAFERNRKRGLPHAKRTDGTHSAHQPDADEAIANSRSRTLADTVPVQRTHRMDQETLRNVNMRPSTKRDVLAS